MTLKEQIHGWMAGREEELIEAMKPLIAVDSTLGESAPGAPFGPGPAEALKRALALAESWGFATGNDDGYVGTADLNSLPDKLHILAHLDIVNVGDGWDTDPFKVVRDGNIIYGRGVSDDKGPAVAAMLAMRCVRELGLPLTGNVKLVLGTDEETGSRDIHHYYSAHPFAPYSVTPDAQFPLINVEKAHYSPKFTKSWEPQPQSKNHLAELKGGIRLNVVPAGCTARILGMSAAEAAPVLAKVQAETGVILESTETENGLVLQATGIQAHAAHFDGSRNAITAMLQALNELPLADDEASRTAKQLHAFFPFEDTAGVNIGIAQSDEVSGALTLVLSLLEIGENGFWGRFDSRDPLCASPETTQHVVEQKMQALGWTVEGTFRPGHHVDADSDFVRTLLNTYTEFSGRPGKALSTGGGTYVHDIPGGVAYGICESDFHSNAHGANECERLSQLLMAAEIYAAVIARLCK